MSVRTAVVLAAGEGTRLRPLTRNRPKPMLPAANRPILEYVLDALIDAGIEEIAVVVGYKRDRVQEHFGPTYRDVPLTYVVQEKQLQSGHALLQAREAVAEPFLVVNGDRVIDPGLVADVMATAERHPDAAATLGVLERREVRQYGAVVLEDGEVTTLIEKPDTDEYRLINAGVYAFDTGIFETIEDTPREGGEIGMDAPLDRLIAGPETVRGVRTEGLWVDATYPWDLLTVMRELLARGRVEEATREADASREPSGDAVSDGDENAARGENDVATRQEDGEVRAEGVWTDESALIHADATLQGPVAVGPDCEVGAGAVVGPNVALGRNVTVGANATVERALLDADTRVGPGSTLIDCVTGEDVHLGADTTIPGGPAGVRVGSRFFENQDLGAVVADRVRSGGDVTFRPGTLVGPAARLHAGVRAEGWIEAEAEVVG